VPVRMCSVVMIIASGLVSFFQMLRQGNDEVEDGGFGIARQEEDTYN
jgi:hypothetical protein